MNTITLNPKQVAALAAKLATYNGEDDWVQLTWEGDRDVIVRNRSRDESTRITKLGDPIAVY